MKGVERKERKERTSISLAAPLWLSAKIHTALSLNSTTAMVLVWQSEAGYSLWYEAGILLV